jgi:EAL and modified HD-GYP domain-containing signal transduction protein
MRWWPPGPADFAQKRVALVPISMDAVVFNRHLPLVAPHTVFLLDRKAASCRRADRRPHRGAARNRLQGGAARRLAGCRRCAAAGQCDMVLLHLHEHTLAEFQTLSKQLRLRYPDLKLVVDGVESWDEQRMCASWGATISWAIS